MIRIMSCPLAWGALALQVGQALAQAGRGWAPKRRKSSKQRLAVTQQTEAATDLSTAATAGSMPTRSVLVLLAVVGSLLLNACVAFVFPPSLTLSMRRLGRIANSDMLSLADGRHQDRRFATATMMAIANSGTKTASRPKRRGGRGRRGSGGQKRVTNLRGKWRVFNVEVPASEDPGKDHVGLSDALLQALASKLGVLDAKDETAALEELKAEGRAVSVVRKSFDARRGGKRGARSGDEPQGPSFTYVVDLELGNRPLKVKLKPEGGRLEVSPGEENVSLSKVLEQVLGPAASSTVGAHDDAVGANEREQDSPGPTAESPSGQSASGVSVGAGEGAGAGDAPVAVIGSGPAGLFAALSLAESGVRCVVIERGQPVEERGRDIGAMLHRRILNQDSNVCYGEGGAGTWSDGKLTTRIGRNSGAVRYVLGQLVRFGAPEGILVQGKPHLGTDRLVRILKTMRGHLESLGVRFMFGSRVEDIVLAPGGVRAVKLRQVERCTSGREQPAGELEELRVSKVVMAAGHSARELYEAVAGKTQSAAAVQAKAFAVGFRIEHPQELINSLQLGTEWAQQVEMGRGKVPVADYRLATQIPFPVPPQRDLEAALGKEWGGMSEGGGGQAASGDGRPVYSFCMCPGGQVMCTSVLPDELCVNGMSFSKRHSKWANSALVTSVEPDEEFLAPYIEEALAQPGGHSAMAGLLFQRAMEQEACRRGGGHLVAPVQRATDFIHGVASEAGPDFPSSSYRLGVKPTALHDLYPASLTLALREALLAFDKRLPGFLSAQALLHGVETRTSSPIRVTRDDATLECLGLPGLYPCGEGAGYAGGIVSSAVDGVRVGAAVLANAQAPTS